MFFWAGRTARGGGGHVRFGRNAFFNLFFLLLFVPGRTADTPRSLALPFFLGASDLLRARCLLCNCRDWMRSKVARVAQVMEPVGGQRQGREGAKWRGIALCCANKSQERCFYIKRRLICLFTCSVCLSVAFVLFTVCYLTKCGCFFVFFFYEHTLKLMGKKVCCSKKKKRCTTVTDWRKLNHAAACVPLWVAGNSVLQAALTNQP